jgi:hypothetical protein
LTLWIQRSRSGRPELRYMLPSRSWVRTVLKLKVCARSTMRIFGYKRHMKSQGRLGSRQTRETLDLKWFEYLNWYLDWYLCSWLLYLFMCESFKWCKCSGTVVWTKITGWDRMNPRSTADSDLPDTIYVYNIHIYICYIYIYNII